MDKKYLIIHMDDMGSSHAANVAGMELFNKGIVTSSSVMMPCAYAYDFIRWQIRNPQYDTGVHFTLTCEWDNAKWRPVGSYSQTASLWNNQQFMWQTNDEVLQNADPQDAYNELEAQVKLALRWGLTPSHFDRHMHTVNLSPELCAVYTGLSQKYNTMFQITKAESILEPNITPLDRLIGVGGKPGLSLQQKFDCLYDLLRRLEPGITQLTIHPVIDTPEIRYIIPDWYERYYEYQMFMADETLEIIKENDIELINYKDLSNMKG